MLLFVLATLTASAFAAPWLKDEFEPCSAKDLEFEKCAVRNIQLAFTKFRGGVPDYELPAFDPWFVPEILMDYSQQGIEGHMLVKNSRAVGLSTAQIQAFRANLTDPDNLEFQVDFYIPHVFVEGEYKADGKIVTFPIGGKGIYNISMDDVSGTWTIQGYLVEVNGEKYMKARHVLMYPQVGNMSVYASNLFTGNDELNKVALQFANDYWPLFYRELLPYAAQGWDQFMRGTLNKLLLSVPFNSLVPDYEQQL
ncbi:hypothetical protein L9F63_005942 [Diploptera punctata]|uniref:Circadian clock-controlled protein n=1 Tax=Diploptera punctata TaxID=6984 RepID=A0AAD7ZBU1_DIPPU|nr:hypothetical protein L9F63_005942 [Diploptera punctata]